MVDGKYAPLLKQILEMLDTACQASLELLAQYASGDINAVMQLLENLRAVADAINTAQTPLIPQLKYAYTTEMLENVTDTLDDIGSSVQGGNRDRAAMKMEFQLLPFLCQLREAFYFWGMIYPDKEQMNRYYQNEFASHFQNPYVQEDAPPRFKLSIVVPAYNHLDVTKQCIDQLLKETDFERLQAELILIDHGSTDGTLEYFESLGVGKVIRFKHNVRMYMVTTFFQICQGQYVALVSNDVLVTRNWAEILLNCLDSDPGIIFAIPTTPNISNIQAINFPTTDPEQFIAWANTYNHPDPTKWNDRARLMPPLGIYRTSAVNQIGFADPYFYSREYYDDDFSMRARRAGYRQIVCDDVACYHFGSVTGKAAQAAEGTLLYGRELFVQKNGIDAWGNGFCYNYQAVQLIMQALAIQGPISVLGLDCGMGDTLLQIRNQLRHQNRECSLYHLTCQKEYYPDLAPFASAKLVPVLSEGISSAFGQQVFSAAYLGRDIGEYEDWAQLLPAIHKRLDTDAYLLFSCSNPFYAQNLYTLLQFSVPGSTDRHISIDPEKVRKIAENTFSQVNVLAVKTPSAQIEQFALQHYGKTQNLPQIVEKLSVSQYYYLCRK